MKNKKYVTEDFFAGINDMEPKKNKKFNWFNILIFIIIFVIIILLLK